MSFIEIIELLRLISLIVICLLSLVLFLIAVFRARKRGFTRQGVALLILSLGALFIVYLAFNVREITPADWAQIMLTIGLVAVTGAYAFSASKQADASAKMAEEMREQRVLASRPVIIQKAMHEKDILEGSRKDYFAHFEISNVGNSPAVEVESSLVDNQNNSLHNIRQTYLKKDDPPIKFRPYNIEGLEEDKTYYLICEYKSIFSYGTQKPVYQTRLPFKISKAERGKIYVVTGELETKEVTERDRINAFGDIKPK